MTNIVKEVFFIIHMNFNFYLGGYGHDHSYRLIFNNGALTISEYQGIPIPEQDKVIAVDDSMDWQLLVEYLKTCNWKRRYDSGILDGTQWELTASGEGIKIRSYGSNAYPENIVMFLMLLNKVTGVVGVRITM